MLYRPILADTCHPNDTPPVKRVADPEALCLYQEKTGSRMSGTPKVSIVLALYNGARFLTEQLDSIVAQDFTDWELIVTDDGSTDNGVEIARQFALTLPDGQMRLVAGPRKGSASNFISGLKYVPEGHHVAFCDQDDVWKPNKLSRALAALEPLDGPALYCARTLVCDEQLRPLAGSRHYVRPYGFRNALVQAAAAGNTCLISPAGVEILQRAIEPALATRLPAHDWWTYLLIAGSGGHVIRANDQVLYYRQHSSNLIGRNDTPGAMMHRLTQLTDGHFGRWLTRNNKAIQPVQHLLSPENRELFQRFRQALDMPGPMMAAEFVRLGLYRQNASATAALLTAASAGRLLPRTWPKTREELVQ